MVNSISTKKAKTMKREQWIYVLMSSTCCSRHNGQSLNVTVTFNTGKLWLAGYRLHMYILKEIK
jgi:hypothetical protein